MKNEVKYWLYYLKEPYELYAYTDNKSYARLFEDSRNMSKFIRIKKYLNKNEIHYLADVYQIEFLEEYKMKIYDKSRLIWIDTELLITKSEEMTITNACAKLMYQELYTMIEFEPRIFKDDIIDALIILGYSDIYNEINGVVNKECSVKPDSLGVFLHYYGKTLKR